MAKRNPSNQEQKRLLRSYLLSLLGLVPTAIIATLKMLCQGTRASVGNLMNLYSTQCSCHIHAGNTVIERKMNNALIANVKYSVILVVAPSAI